MLGFFPISSNPISSTGSGPAAELSAIAVCSSKVDANLTTNIQLTSIDKCVVNNSAALTNSIQLAATAVSRTTTTANLTTAIQFSAVAVCSSKVDANLTAAIQFKATANSVVTLGTLNLNTQINLAAIASSLTRTGADLATQVKLNTSITANTSTAATLSTAINLASIDTCRVNNVAVLTNSIQLAATAVSRTTTTANLATQIRLTASARVKTVYGENQLKYSEQFDNAVWSKNNVSILPNAVIAPDGTSTADKLVELATTNTQHLLAQAVTTTAGQVYTRSIYARAAEWTSFQMQLGNGGPQASFNLSTQIATPSLGATAANIIDVGNGWFYCTFTGPSNGSAQQYIYKTSGTYTGDGVSGIYLWGASLVLGSAAGDYIQTTDTAFNNKAALTTGIQLTSVVNSRTSTAATLSTAIQLASIDTCTVNNVAILTTGIQLTSSVSCRTTVNAANLVTQIKLASIDTCTVNNVAILTNSIQLAAAAVSNTTTTAPLTTQIRLNSVIYTQTYIPTANLTTNNFQKTHNILVKFNPNEFCIQHNTNDITIISNDNSTYIIYNTNTNLIKYNDNTSIIHNPHNNTVKYLNQEYLIKS